MEEIDINDVASIGSIRDVPSYMMPPEAWTSALNMRAQDGGMLSLLGWTSVFGTPTVAPYFLMPVSTVAQQFWIYSGLAKAYGFDGTTHTNITRQAAGVDVNYTASDSAQFNGTMLGGIPVFNNGADVPQFWPTPTLATRLQNLTNWPAANRTKIMRAFGPILMAFGLSDAGVVKSHLVRWSHPADPGSVPISWDVTDPTRDAGEVDLSDVASGIIQDALPLGDTMFIYKEGSIWKCRYVGGQSVMDFGQAAWLNSIGLLAARCVALSGDGLKHVLATQDDIIWHNGNSVRSILNQRQRRRLFNEIDTVNFAQSFMFSNPMQSEMWFCYPTAGSNIADKALIMNYREQEQWVITEADGITFRAVATGSIENPSEETWDGTEDIWEDDTGPWSELARRRVVAASPSAVKFFNLDFGTTRDTVTFTCTLSRESLSLLGQKRNGEWIVDHQFMKLFQNIRPKLQGGPISVRVGTQMVVNGPITWSLPLAYDNTFRVTNHLPVSGISISLEFSAPSLVPFRLDGYKVNVKKLGEF